MSAPAPSPTPTTLSRLTSLDAYRGFVMLLMMGEVLELRKVAQAVPTSRFWNFLAYHQSHVAWAGCSLHDLIQPSFSFLVGAALPFSLASRLARGDSKWWLALHALWRSLVLIALGIFLRTMGDDKPATNFTFEDTLTQIGLGYFPLFVLGLVRPRWQWVWLVLLLAATWTTFILYPVPSTQNFYSMSKVGVEPNWEHHYDLRTLEAHWNKNSNAAWAFDRWFLNQFHREDKEGRENPFLFNSGGYATLSFVPTLATMLLGLIAGGWLRRATVRGDALKLLPYGDEIEPRRALVWFLLTGVLCYAAAVGLDLLGLCPIVKRIWTPTWTLYSGGWCFVLLAAFYAATDFRGWRAWAFPLVVIGANSIAAYLMDHVLKEFTKESFEKHLGWWVPKLFQWFGAAYEPLLEGLAVLLVYWLVLFWMYRRKLFLKI